MIVLEQAHRRLAIKYHPDKNSGGREAFEQVPLRSPIA